MVDWKRWMKEMFYGEHHYLNQYNEFVRVVYREETPENMPLIVYTNQDNGWIRWNEYDKDGHCVGEGFEGKWK